jgi:hypothetical protein
LEEVPFYAWNCLTLCLKNRNIDLVIKDEADMDMLLKFLIYKLKTQDGVRNSAKDMITMLNEQCRKARKKECGGKLSTIEEHKTNQGTMHLINNKVMFKYNLMKVRNKISFIALQKKKAICELIIESIVCTYKQLVHEGTIVEDAYKY